MRNILFICGCVLLVLSFQFVYAGSSTGHQIIIQIQHHPHCKQKAPDAGGFMQNDSRNSSDSFDHDKRNRDVPCLVSLGPKGSNMHHQWPGQDNLISDKL